MDLLCCRASVLHVWTTRCTAIPVMQTVLSAAGRAWHATDWPRLGLMVADGLEFPGAN